MPCLDPLVVAPNTFRSSRSAFRRGLLRPGRTRPPSARRWSRNLACRFGPRADTVRTARPRCVRPLRFRGTRGVYLLRWCGLRNRPRRRAFGVRWGKHPRRRWRVTHRRCRSVGQAGPCTGHRRRRIRRSVRRRRRLILRTLAGCTCRRKRLGRSTSRPLGRGWHGGSGNRSGGVRRTGHIRGRGLRPTSRESSCVHGCFAIVARTQNRGPAVQVRFLETTREARKQLPFFGQRPECAIHVVEQGPGVGLERLREGVAGFVVAPEFADPREVVAKLVVDLASLARYRLVLLDDSAEPSLVDRQLLPHFDHLAPVADADDSPSLLPRFPHLGKPAVCCLDGKHTVDTGPFARRTAETECNRMGGASRPESEGGIR